MRSVLVRRALVLFLPVAAVLTLTVGLVYASIQQVYRNLANDPQIQMAIDSARRLDRGVLPAAVARGERVDLAGSLATHISVYGRDGMVLASTAHLDGTTPVPPHGVLSTAQKGGRNVLTWQPRSGVRVAAVVVPWRHGTVLVGRSLIPSEDRERDLEGILALGWIVGLVGLAAIALFAARLWPTHAT